MLQVSEEQASGIDLVGSGTAQYTLRAENDPIQYIRPEVGGSPPVNIVGNLADSSLTMTVVLEETSTTTGYSGSLGFFTDGSAIADVDEGTGSFLTFTPATIVSDVVINPVFTNTGQSSIRADELTYAFDVVGDSFGTAARRVTVSDNDGSSESFIFTVEVTEAVLIFRIKVFLEGAAE